MPLPRTDSALFRGSGDTLGCRPMQRLAVNDASSRDVVQSALDGEEYVGRHGAVERVAGQISGIRNEAVDLLIAQRCGSFGQSFEFRHGDMITHRVSQPTAST